MTARPGGTGLGLALARRIAAAHGGIPRPRTGGSRRHLPARAAARLRRVESPILTDRLSASSPAPPVVRMHSGPPDAPDPSARRPHAQSSQRRSRAGARTAGGGDGTQRRRQVVAGARYALCRGPAALRRELQPLRAPVPRAARASAHGRAGAHRGHRRGRPSRAGQVEPLDAGDDGRPRAVPRRPLRMRGHAHLPRLRPGGRRHHPACRREEPRRVARRRPRAGDLPGARRRRRAVPRAPRESLPGRLPPARRGRGASARSTR